VYVSRHAETGVAPLVIAATTIASSIFSRIGGVLTWGATLAWVSSAVGDDDETLQPKIEEPLTKNARNYYVTVDLANWEKVARARFTGSRLAAALKAVEQGRQILGEPDATMLTMLATMKSINVLFEELRTKEDAAKTSTSASAGTSSAPTPKKDQTPSAGPGWGGAGAASKTTAKAASAKRGDNVWPWIFGAAAAAAAVRLLRRRTS